MNSTTTTSRYRRGLLAATGLAALLAFAAQPAQAQDKATLDLLVQKGVITQADADGVAKSAAVPVVTTPKDAAVKGLKIEGLMQTQFDFLSTSDSTAGAPNPAASNQFFIRRAYLGAVADLGNGWSGELEMDFATGAQGQGGYTGLAADGAQNNFEKFLITKKLDDYDGALTLGFQKVHFTQEEYTPTATVKAIERSVVSRYFDETHTAQTSGRLGFADRHNGIYWDGKIGTTGISYGATFATGIQNSTGYSPTAGSGGFNTFSYWGYLQYAGSFSSLNYKVGLNAGLSQDGNSIAAQANSVWGYNPYVSLTYGSAFQLDAEFEQALVTNGRSNGLGGATTTSRAAPYGINITPSYKINDYWEVATRYSYLNTNGRGVSINNVTRNAENVSTPGTLFDDAQQFYVGLNWYVMKNSSLEFSVGYEYDEFTHRATSATVNDANLTGPRASVSGIRARMQLTF